MPCKEEEDEVKSLKAQKYLNTNLTNLTNYDEGGKGFTVHGSGLKVHDYDARGKVTSTVMRTVKVTS